MLAADRFVVQRVCKAVQQLTASDVKLAPYGQRTDTATKPPTMPAIEGLYGGNFPQHYALYRWAGTNVRFLTLPVGQPHVHLQRS